MRTTYSDTNRTLIRDLRLSASMTQTDLAIASGASIAYVQRLEAGVFPKRHGTPAMTAVCDALGVAEAHVRGEVASNA